jgi:hypothetical protein
VDLSIKITNTPRIGICGKHTNFSHENILCGKLKNALEKLDIAQIESALIDVLFEFINDKKFIENNIYHFQQLLP